MDISLLLIIILVSTMLLWENIFPRRIYDKKLKLQSYLTDILLSIFNNIILYLFSVISLYYIAENMSTIDLFSNLNFQNPIIIIGTILFLDLSIYVWHYLNHKFEALWFFHKVHHSEKYLNTLSGIRFHFGELFGSILFKSVLLIFFLGIPIKLILVSETLILLSSLFHHSNIRFKSEKLLGLVFIMPYMHEVHHSTLREEHDSNYGVVFSFWDRIFRTFKEVKVKKIGLQGVPFQNIFETIRFGFMKK